MTDTAGSKLRPHGPAGATEPRSTPDERAAAAHLEFDRAYHAEAVRKHRASMSRRLIEFRTMRVRDRRWRTVMEKMTAPVRRALVILLEDGEVEFGRHYWTGKSGRQIEFKTVIAMYDRYYVKIAIEHRGKGRQLAVLTEPGARIARDLKRETAS
jgi:hypothetical protein